MSLGRPPKDQSREASDMSCGRGTGEDKARSSATCTASDMSCGRGTGEDKARSSATCTEGRGRKGSFFSRNVVF